MGNIEYGKNTRILNNVMLWNKIKKLRYVCHKLHLPFPIDGHKRSLMGLTRHILREPFHIVYIGKLRISVPETYIPSKYHKHIIMKKIIANIFHDSIP
jgi:hypothetical protein